MSYIEIVLTVLFEFYAQKHYTLFNFAFFLNVYESHLCTVSKHTDYSSSHYKYIDCNELIFNVLFHHEEWQIFLYPSSLQ